MAAGSYAFEQPRYGVSRNILLNTRIGWAHQDLARTVWHDNGLALLHELLNQILTRLIVWIAIEIVHACFKAPW